MSRDNYYRGRQEGRQSDYHGRSHGGWGNYREQYNDEYHRSHPSHRFNNYDSDIYENEIRGRDQGRYREDDRNFFERAGDRIRDTWDRWTDDDREQHGNRDTYYSNRDYSQAQYEGSSNYRGGQAYQPHGRDHDHYRGSRDWDHDHNYRNRYEDERDYDRGRSRMAGQEAERRSPENHYRHYDRDNTRGRYQQEEGGRSSNNRSRSRQSRDNDDTWSNAYLPMSNY